MSAAPKVFGVPGRHARSLQAISQLRAVASWVLFAVVFAGMVRLGGISLLFASGSSRVLGFILFAVLVLIATFARNLHIAAARARVGAEAEELVGEVLASSSSVAVVHGALLGAGGDADHVVLGPSVVVLETKHGRGDVRITENAVFVGRKRLPKDPVSQLRRQTMALKRELNGVWVDSVLCITGMTGSPFQARGVTVCNPTDLPLVLSSFRRSINAANAISMARSLSAAKPSKRKNRPAPLRS